MHRGYYCPSIIEDLLISNTSRGRMINKRDNYNYEYHYDINDRLICVKSYGEYGHDTVEYIVNIENKSIGFTYSSGIINKISLCIYQDNELVEYSRLSVIDNKASSAEIKYNPSNLEAEYYYYKNNQLEYVDRYSYNNNPILDHNKFIFQYDENGNIKTYTTIVYRGSEIGSEIERIYTKNKIRKETDLLNLVNEDLKSYILKCDDKKINEICSISLFTRDVGNYLPQVLIGHQLKEIENHLDINDPYGYLLYNYNEDVLFEESQENGDIIDIWILENKYDQNDKIELEDRFKDLLNCVIGQIKEDSMIMNKLKRDIPILLHIIED